MWKKDLKSRLEELKSFTINELKIILYALQGIGSIITSKPAKPYRQVFTKPIEQNLRTDLNFIFYKCHLLIFEKKSLYHTIDIDPLFDFSFQSC